MKKLPQLETLQQRKIYGVLRLFFLYCNTGILPLAGLAEFPEDEALYLMRAEEYTQYYKAKHHGATPENIPTKGGGGIPYAQRVVEAVDSVRETIRDAGGLDTFKAAFMEVSKTHPRNMAVLLDLSRRAATLETAADIAERFYITEQYVYKIKKKILIAVAINISLRANREKAETKSRI